MHKDPPTDSVSDLDGLRGVAAMTLMNTVTASVVLCRYSDDGGTGNDDDVDRRFHVDSEVYDFATCPADGNGTEKKIIWAVVQTWMKKKERKKGCRASVMAPWAVLGVT